MAFFTKLIQANLGLILWGVILLFVPIILRSLLLRIALVRGASKYRKKLMADMGRDFETAKDRIIIKQMLELLRYRLRKPFNFLSALQEDIYSLLALIETNCSPPEKKNHQELEFQFSLKKLLQVSFLAFDETYSDLESRFIYKMLKGRKLFWFRGFFTFGNYYNKILSSIPLLSPLLKNPLGGFLIRLLFIPLFGLPSLIWYNIRTLMVGFFSEGAFRFFYISIILRITRYGLFLYGEENPQIEEDLKKTSKEALSQKINTYKNRLDDLHLEKASRQFPQALKIYQNILSKHNLQEDDFWVKQGQMDLPYKRTRFLSRFKDFFFPEKVSSAMENNYYLDLLYNIPKAYGYTGKNNFLHLTVEDSIHLGYVLSLQGVSYILSTPGLQQMAHVPMNFIIKLQAMTSDPRVKSWYPHIKNSYKGFRTFNRIRKAFKTVSRRTGIYSLAFSLSTPVIWTNIQKSFASFLAHRYGRTLLLVWGDHFLGRKRPMNIYLKEGGIHETAKDQ